MPTMRKMHTQNEVEAMMAPTIAQLYAAIAGKIAFDMQVEIGNGPYAIPSNTFNNTEGSANIPCIAKLVQTSTKKPLGFALVTASGANYEIIYLFQGNIYKASGVAYDAAFTLGSGTDALLQVDNAPTKDSQKLVKSGGVFSFVKPIYCHPVSIGYKDTVHEFMATMLIFNDSPTPFTFASFNTWLRGLVSDISAARLMLSGYVILSGVRYPVSLLFADTTVRQIVVSPSVIDSVLDTFTLSAWESMEPQYFQDSVNRIN